MASLSIAAAQLLSCAVDKHSGHLLCAPTTVGAVVVVLFVFLIVFCTVLVGTGRR